mgnify:CR=1 FL=1
MSEAKKNNEIKQESASLNPIPAEKRIMSWGSNTMLWLGGCISIGTLAQGSAQLEAGLNLTQLFLAVAIGSLILVVGIALNDQFSYKTGAPYAVQLRSAFGTKGNVVPSLIRGLPAIVWYGYQTWLGGAAINNITIALFGFDNIWLCSSCSRSSRFSFPLKDSRAQNGSVILAALSSPSPCYIFSICASPSTVLLSARI